VGSQWQVLGLQLIVIRGIYALRALNGRQSLLAMLPILTPGDIRSEQTLLLAAA